MTTLSLSASSSDSENSTLDILYTQSIKFQGADTGDDLLPLSSWRWGTETPRIPARTPAAVAAAQGDWPERIPLNIYLNNLNSDRRYL